MRNLSSIYRNFLRANIVGAPLLPYFRRALHKYKRGADNAAQKAMGNGVKNAEKSE